MYVRAGTATPAPGATFGCRCRSSVPVTSRSTATPGTGGWPAGCAGMLLRSLAALPEGPLRVLPVDGGTLGAVFAPFRQLVEAQVWRRPATDLDAFRDVLDQAEEQTAVAQTTGAHDLPYLLIACAALPAGSGGGDYARLAALAHAGPAARVHLLLAGYPPVGPAGYDAPPRLDHTTYLTAQERPVRRLRGPGPEPAGRAGRRPGLSGPAGGRPGRRARRDGVPAAGVGGAGAALGRLRRADAGRDLDRHVVERPFTPRSGARGGPGGSWPSTT